MSGEGVLPVILERAKKLMGKERGPFTARLKIEREGGKKISAFDLEGEFKTFNRVWRATRKMLTADQDWDNAVVIIGRELKEVKNDKA